MPGELGHGIGQQFKRPTGATLRGVCASRCDQQCFFLAGELALRRRTRILAQCPFQIAFHEAAFSPVHGGTAHRHRTRNLFIAVAGIGRQQDLGALEFAGGMLAVAQHRREFTAFDLAQFDPIAYIHLPPCSEAAHERMNRMARVQPQKPSPQSRAVPCLHPPYSRMYRSPPAETDMHDTFKSGRLRFTKWCCRSSETVSSKGCPGHPQHRGPRCPKDLPDLSDRHTQPVKITVQKH